MRFARLIQRCLIKPISNRTPLRSKSAMLSAAALAVTLTMSSGCDIKSFFDPSEMFPNTKKLLQKPIITSLSTIEPGVDDPEDQFYNAVEVQPSDLESDNQDYRIGKGDLLSINVTDLVGIGQETQKQTRVSESGNISMPLLGQIHAEGMTEDELQTAITAAYRNAQIINSAQVSVTVVEPRNATFSVLGAVGGPGQFAIVQSDFRVLDALVLARDVAQSVDTVYVIRQVNEDPLPGGMKKPAMDKGPQATPPTNPVAPTNPPTNPLTPPAGAPPTGPDPLNPGAPPATPAVPHTVLSLQTTGDGAGAPAGTATGAPAPAGGAAPAGGFAFSSPDKGSTRTIRIPVNSLKNGELKYNIVIRPHDMIIAPTPTFGYYYMGGHVTRTGVYSLSALKITVKQAIISAGMLDGVAIPQRTELIRRVGPAREAFVRIDVDAIFAGEASDIYLKPNDVLQIGTNPLAPFIQDLRTGFRITYGFGFLYDRNYAPQQAT